jgi:hypothetical protein
VPEAKAAGFDSPLWEKACKLNDFRLSSIWNWGEPTPARAPTEVAVLHDGTTLYFRYTAHVTNGVPTRMPKGAADIWPVGDHGEIVLRTPRDTFLFAFDGSGNTYDARALDRRWNSEWRVQARAEGTRWEAIAAIPMAAIGFTPEGKGAGLSLLILRQAEVDGVQEESALNGGILGRSQYPMIME